VFLAGGALWRYVAPCALALSPVFFAGVIFARSFRNVLIPTEVARDSGMISPTIPI
jgi:hypothetical protein